jgi:uncharacterized membrane protein
MTAPTAPTTSSGLSNNASGAIAYLTFVPAVIFLLLEPYKNNSYVRFHSWQSILLAAISFVCNIMLKNVLAALMWRSPSLCVTVVGVVSLAFFAVWLITLINASQGKLFKLPVIGDLAEKQANK